MKLHHKFLSVLMAFCLLFGAISVLGALPVFAEEVTTSGEATTDPEEDTTDTVDYLNDGFESEEAKLASMQVMLERYGFRLYCDTYTGEVAVENVKTGDRLFTNPYDVGNTTAATANKQEMLSQIVLRYSDVEGNTHDMLSYVDAALFEQIKVKKIKNGIRVEYILGEQEGRSLLPEMIEKSRFEEKIFNLVTNPSHQNLLKTFYQLRDPNDPSLTPSAKAAMYKDYPITKKMAIYIFDTKATKRDRVRVESVFRQYCPDYTYEERDYDHDLTEYEADEEVPPQFRMALEYYLDESGLSVRLPANGIRFDQGTYQLEWIRLLPYMGAGSAEFSGYTMIPDGSGTLVRFEDIVKGGIARVLTGKMYGQDYAYHVISGANQQIMRLPIFGMVENAEYTTVNAETGETETYQRSNGYVAIIEEGDSLATIVSKHGTGIGDKYNEVYTEFNPRPKDTYKLSSISVAGNDEWTVVSDRKYTGSFRLRYIMLTDMEYAAENGIDATGCYDTSYVGMAMAYRDRLIREGKLTALNTEKEQIPLYLETLGAMDVQEKFLSIPVTVKKALTTFEDIKTITAELGEAGITNLVYKLTGYANGGLKNSVPSELDIEKVVGNDKGLKNLENYLSDLDMELYLDVDFSYAKKDGWFDGFNKKTQAVRTIDGRYTQKRTYSAALQTFTSTGLIAISPSVFGDIFDDLESDLERLDLTRVSLGAVGSDLNSDFDESDPYNREDSKNNIAKALAAVRESGYKVMMDGGNAFAIPYADHVLGAPLDSSKYTYASEAIPLYGLIFHGYVSFAGQATNTAGDIRYEILKILENGANPYFILVYRNSEKLKEDKDLSSYFSISYENWKEDMIDTYLTLNEALSPVLNATIVDHEFLIGERVPDEDEALADEEEAKRQEEEAKREEEASRAESERLENLESHLASKHPQTTAPETTEPVTTEPVTTEPDSTENEEPEVSGTEGDTTSSEGDTTTAEGDTTSSEEVTSEVVTTTPPTTGPVVPVVPVDPDKADYEYTKYSVDNGMIVRVTYENGYVFVLNYNIYDVTVNDYEDVVIPALGFIVLNADGEIVINSGEEAAA